MSGFVLPQFQSDRSGIHDGDMVWTHTFGITRYRPFVQGILRFPMDFLYKRAIMQSFDGLFVVNQDKLLNNQTSVRWNESLNTHVTSSVWGNDCITFSAYCKIEQLTAVQPLIMGTIVSQITSLTIVYSTVYSGADQRKHQSSASLAFVWGIHRGPVNSPHKWPVTRKMFPFDDVIMQVISLDSSVSWWVEWESAED